MALGDADEPHFAGKEGDGEEATRLLLSCMLWGTDESSHGNCGNRLTGLRKPQRWTRHIYLPPEQESERVCPRLLELSHQEKDNSVEP